MSNEILYIILVYNTGIILVVVLVEKVFAAVVFHVEKHAEV